MGIRIADEALSAAVRIRGEHKSLMAAARAAGLPENTFRDRLVMAAQRGLDGSIPKPLPVGQVLNGTTTLYDSAGKTILQWVRAKDDNNVANFVTAIRDLFDEYKGKSDCRLIPAPKKSDSNLLSVYPIGDAHLGLLSRTGTGEKYTLKIGADRLRETAAKLISQSPPSQEAIILNLGDYQHTDDSRNATPAHHNQLDVSGSYFEILKTCVQVEMDIVDLALQKHQTVTLRNLPGNHDPHSSLALTIAMAAFYANNPRVKVDLTESDFFYRRFGATLIGATHGHKMRAPQMAMAMAVQCREDWGATLYHWFLFGHIHHLTAEEIGDVRCESFQTLSAKDAFGVGKGYVSGKSMQSVTLHHDDGEIGRHRVNVPPPG